MLREESVNQACMCSTSIGVAVLRSREALDFILVLSCLFFGIFGIFRFFRDFRDFSCFSGFWFLFSGFFVFFGVLVLASGFWHF